MTKTLQYVTDEQGQPVGVLLDIEEYHRLTSQSTPDPDLLVGLSKAELQALAESELAPSAQVRLNNLLTRSKNGPLSSSESAELDRLLEQIDQLTVLKTRAKYTFGSAECWSV